jgi:hypothetical protein
MNLTPKQEFQRNRDRVLALERVLDSADFQAALLAAFNNLCWNLPASENPQHGWNANCKRAGARAFIEELQGLVSVREPNKTPSQNLE